MKTEEQYLEMADEAAERKQPFSAVVYAFLGLIAVFRDIRNTLSQIQNHLETQPDYSYTYIPPATFEPITVFGQDDGGTAAPFCPYCAQSFPTNGICANPDCPEKQISSIGADVV